MNQSKINEIEKIKLGLRLPKCGGDTCSDCVETANTLNQLLDALQDEPEVVDVDTYVKAWKDGRGCGYQQAIKEAIAVINPSKTRCIDDVIEQLKKLQEK